MSAANGNHGAAIAAPAPKVLEMLSKMETWTEELRQFVETHRTRMQRAAQIPTTPADFKPTAKVAAARSQNAEKPNCPECGKVMRIRVSDWGRFWGCSSYPQCQGKRSLASAQKDSKAWSEGRD